MEQEETKLNPLVRRIIPIAIVSLSIAALISLFFAVTIRLNELRSTSVDNLTWALSQVEVETLLLKDIAFVSEQNDGSDLQEVRRRFNNLYSRVNLITVGPAFGEMRQDKAFAGQLVKLQKCLDKLVPYIDADDAALQLGLPALLAELEVIRNDVHDIALTGLKIRSLATDEERSGFTQLLTLTAAVAAALVIFLMGMLFFILRQYRAFRIVSADVEQAKLRLQSTFEVSLDAIVVADDTGIILDFNSSAEKVFGFSKDEVIGRQMAELIIPEQYRDAHYKGMERFNRTFEPKLVGQGRIEITALRKTGEEFPVEISIGMTRKQGGTVFISYLRDITERLAAEQNLKQARDEALQAEKAKSNFLAVMSHEMRTPLNGVFGSLELLAKTKLTKTQTRYNDIVKHSADILMHHVNDVLDVSRMDAGKMELATNEFDLHKFFKDVVTTNEATAANKSISLGLNMTELPQLTVCADEHRLRQIAFNLISNALKFTEKGSITISARTEKLINNAVSLHFSVSDTGIGISDKDQEHVFDRFFTQEKSYDRLASGAGLGLTICKQIIEMMEGNISFESAVGQGTTFHVSVPLEVVEPAQVAHVEVAPQIDTPLFKNETVLLVEDNAINRMIVCEMLTDVGLQVTEAANGQEAVDLAQEKKFSAILMDISMPVMNGIDATTAIRNSDNPNKDTKIFALTAHALEEELENFIEAGVDACLDKPVSQERLTRTLFEAISGNRLEGTETKPSDTKLLDRETIASLISVMNDKKLLKIATSYTTEINNLIALFPKYLNEDEIERLARETHKSVGSTGMLGALRFQEDLRRLEQAARSANLKEAKIAADVVSKNWPVTSETLNKALLNYP